MRYRRFDRLAGGDRRRRIALDRRSHERDAAPSRSRRQRRLGRGGGRGGALPAPARHHRSQPRRRAADALRRPALRHHLQRRDLQLPRYPCASLPPPAGPCAATPTPKCCSKPARSGASRRRSSAPSACSPSRCGIVRRGPCMLARDRLGIKPLYYAAKRGARAVRLPAQGVARRPGLAADDRRRCGRRLSAPRLHRAAAHHLSRSREAAARPHPDAARGRGAGAAMLLGPARHRHRRPGAQRPGSGRTRGGRAARRAAARLRQVADDRRRAARRLSLGRDQFLDRRRA